MISESIQEHKEKISCYCAVTINEDNFYFLHLAVKKYTEQPKS